MSLRDELKQLIEGKGVAVSKLARLAGIHRDTIDKFLNGETEMTAANLDKLFKILRPETIPANANASSAENDTNPSEVGNQGQIT